MSAIPSRIRFEQGRIYSMLSLSVFFLLVFGVAFIASRYEPGSWYAGLNKPAWTPPNWVFGPVWTLLYLAIAFAGWLIWRNSGEKFYLALLLWIVQLVLNGVWSWLFFGLQNPAAAFVDIVLLLGAIIFFIVISYPLSRPASWLFIPYGCWVAFALFLNFTLWRMNLSTVNG